MPKHQRPPRYLRQRGTGRPDRAYCRLNGKKVHLGSYGSPESRQKFAEVIACWRRGDGSSQNAEPTSPEDLTVSQLILGFLEFASSDYDAREAGHFVSVCKLLRQYAGDTPATSFGPKRFKEIRQAMIEKGWARKSINRQCVRLRQIFNWAVGEELIPPHESDCAAGSQGLEGGAKWSERGSPVLTRASYVVQNGIAGAERV